MIKYNKWLENRIPSPPPVPMSQKLSQFGDFKKAIEKKWGGTGGTGGVFTDEFFSNIGFDVRTLINNNFIQREHGGWILNPNLLDRYNQINQQNTPRPLPQWLQDNKAIEAAAKEKAQKDNDYPGMWT